MTLTPPLFEVLPRDLSAYREGSTGIPYVHRFASGEPGPHVLINALTHGNEICGMVAATHLLDSGVRPLKGTLTISFANMQAYESFDRSRPFDSRQIDHNLNRVWSAAELDGSLDSIEMRRARELRPVVAAADHILDIHSTSQDVEPFWVYPAFARNAEVACAIGRPGVHLLMPSGLGSGTPLIQHGRLGEVGGAGTGLVVECGQHFLRSAGEVATTAALDFLGHFGLIERERPAPGPQRRYELLKTCMVTTPEFRFTRPLVGFEVFAEGELIATDGAQEIRALCDGCTVMMPTRAPIVGREAVYLTRPVP
ncbi:succinylglutamate desuccinylase/aspartoacylase domain-containing protein [Acidovorax sp. NCPPB 3576]|uniref:succinylglutamate desuccinylase/aspartoacylase domain-containing protein n=1 Tax=Acidovorax sp. NCPPB 3576 TaxID=2940488 RepID=UPI00234BB4F3|nr:succinylglutamate desuccinylase/aspartoacylase family protein [Acidovorax sp. NCPPB 3576]WCM86569.1 succinylglutamate desuccinylase/aspartoacylase family protein [Acidovorax sp. NCPPB 3576]